MPQIANGLSTDQELLLIMERDIPNLQEDMEDVKEMVKACARDIEDIKNDLSGIKSQMSILASNKEMPWYQDFQKILILLFSIGFMILAGVKAYEGLTDKILPSVSITSTGE